jgi:hypothetical protein
MKKRVLVSVFALSAGLSLSIALLTLITSGWFVDQPSSRCCGYHPSIRVQPDCPTVNEVVSVTVSGEWYDACVPAYYTHHVCDDVIQIEVAVTRPITLACAAVIMPWRVTTDLGRLPAGSYQVDLIVHTIDRPCGAETCASKSFRVCEQLHHIQVPLVGAHF